MNHKLLSPCNRSAQITQPSSKVERSTQVTAGYSCAHKLDLNGLPAQQVPSRLEGCWDSLALHFGLSHSHAELQTTNLALKKLSSSSIGWSRCYILQWRPSAQDESVMIFPVCQTSVTLCWTATSYRCLSLYHWDKVFELLPLMSMAITKYPIFVDGTTRAK